MLRTIGLLVEGLGFRVRGFRVRGTYIVCRLLVGIRGVILYSMIHGCYIGMNTNSCLVSPQVGLGFLIWSES